MQIERLLPQPKEQKSIVFLVLLLFLVAPFQRRFHGFFDSLSRSLTLPDFPLPEFFSRKIHLFATDLLIVALVLFLFFRLKVSLRAFFWEGPSKYLALLFFVFLLSTATSITQNYALQYLRLFQFSLAFLLFNAAKTLCTPRLVYKVAWLIVAIASFESLLGVYQYFAQDALGLKFFGEINPKVFPFPNPGVGKLLGLASNSAFIYRVSGTFLHPNIFGGFLFCSLLASCYLCTVSKMRVLLIGLIFLQIFALCLSFSRAALLALIVSSLIWCFLQWKNVGLRTEAFKRFGLIAGAVFCSILIGVCLLYPQLKARGGLFNYNHNTLGADVERIMYINSAVEMIKERPLLGVGYNNFQIHNHLSQDSRPLNYLHSKVHNIYLLIASEAGLLGFGAFLLFLVSLMRIACKNVTQEKMFLISAFIGFLIIGLCDFYFLETPQGSIPFFGIAGLLSRKITL